METVVQIAAVCLAAAVLGAVLRQHSPETAAVLGLAVCYAFGTAWFMIVYAKNSGSVGLLTALGWCVFPFILPDCVKMALAILIAKRLPKRLIQRV